MKFVIITIIVTTGFYDGGMRNKTKKHKEELEGLFS